MSSVSMPSVVDNQPILNLQSEQPTAKKYNFREAAELQKQADKTQKVFTKGLVDNELLIKKLAELGITKTGADKLEEFGVAGETPISAAIQNVAEYNKEGKLHVRNLVERNYELSSEIKKQEEIQSLERDLWDSESDIDSDSDSDSADPVILRFRATFTTLTAHQRPQLPIAVCALIGAMIMNQTPLQGLVVGALFSHTFNKMMTQ
jgi:hypothetical protein